METMHRRSLLPHLWALHAVLIGLTMWTAAPQAAPVNWKQEVASAPHESGGCHRQATTPCIQYCGLICQALPAPAAGVVVPASLRLVLDPSISNSLEGISPPPARPPPR